MKSRDHHNTANRYIDTWQLFPTYFYSYKCTAEQIVSITHVSDNPHPTPPARTKLVIMRHYYIDKWIVCQNARLYM